MRIEEWFDVRNPSHIRAFKELRDTGAWPPGFIPADVTLSHGWHSLLCANMADAWIEEQMAQIEPTSPAP